MLETPITNYGTTGTHYDRPEGRGAGHALDWFSTAQFAPEAFYPHRIWWDVRQQFMEEHREAVTAFLVANQQAAGDLAAMTPGQVTSGRHEGLNADLPGAMVSGQFRHGKDEPAKQTPDLADAAGVSFITAWRALNQPDLVREKTADKVRAAELEVGYVTPRAVTAWPGPGGPTAGPLRPLPMHGFPQGGAPAAG